MNKQRGGFVMGLIVGLLLGLAVALGVALYVTKVPVPFMNKVPQRTAEQDEAETLKNKNWDPNAPLAGKSPARPATVASGVIAPPPAAPATASTPAANAKPTAAPAASTRDPAAILADRPAVTNAATTPSSAGAVGQAAKPGADPYSYFVQAGAYARAEDAEQQRAKLAMLGLEAKLTEREQSGRTVYRVRVGPFEQREQADAAKEKLGGSGIESALVRVQK